MVVWQRLIAGLVLLVLAWSCYALMGWELRRKGHPMPLYPRRWLPYEKWLVVSRLFAEYWRLKQREGAPPLLAFLTVLLYAAAMILLLTAWR